MDASGVFPRGIGQTRLDAIAEYYDLMELAKIAQTDQQKTVETITQVPGFQQRTALMVAQGLPKVVKWIATTGLKIHEKDKIAVRSKKLEGQRVTFTGFRDKQAEATIVENGGQIVGFGTKTTILLVSPTGRRSGKAEKAEQNGIQVMTIEQFYKKFGIKT
jgi:hypothetical protein